MLPAFIHLRALAAVMEEGGIRSASARLGVSHSAVSRSLSEIEAVVGVPVTRRRNQGRKIELTPEGRLLANAAVSAMAGLEAAVAAISRPRSRNSVVINTTSSFASRWLFPRMLEHKQALSGIDVSVTISRDVAAPQTQGADLSIRFGPGPWPEAGAAALCNDLLLPVASPGYLRSLPPGTGIGAMRLLHDRDPGAQWRDWMRAYGLGDSDAGSGLQFDSGDIVLRAAECGEGVALARLSMIRDSLQAGLLAAPFGDKALERPNSIWLVQNPGTAARGPVSRVADWLRRVLSEESLRPIPATPLAIGGAWGYLGRNSGAD